VGKRPWATARKDPDARRPAVLSVDNDFGREVATGFIQPVEKRGVKVVVRQMYTYPAEKDFRPLLTRIKAAGRDLLSRIIRPLTGYRVPHPMIDAEHVANAVVHIASRPLDANILRLTGMATKMPFVGRG
jgi:hypothetical protein